MPRIIVHLYRVILGLQGKSIPRMVEVGQNVCNGFTTHPTLFLNPDPQVPVLQTYVQDVITAQQTVRVHTTGAAEARNVKAGVLFNGLVRAQGYVQGLVDNAPLDQGPLIIRAGGMQMAAASSYVKPLIRATQVLPSAPVHLETNVAALIAGLKGRVSFNWQLSSDGGKTWLSLPSTPHGRTDIAGLTPLQTYAFRVSVTSRAGTGAWTEAAPFMVH